MFRLLRYVMGLNALEREYHFMRGQRLTAPMVAALDQHMAKFPTYGGWFLPPLQDMDGNTLRWASGYRLGS